MSDLVNQEKVKAVLRKVTREQLADAWDEGRDAVIRLGSDNAAHEDPFDGYIDQHVIAIGGSRLSNPYREESE